MKSIRIIFAIFAVMVLVSCEPIEVKQEKNGAFSISENKKVVFSQGNLQYIISEDKWRFADNQFDYIGLDNIEQPIKREGYGNTWISSTGNLRDTIDLFGWGTGSNPTLTSDSYKDYPTFVDWGKNQIGNDTAGVWRSLSSEEMVYLLKERKDALLLCGLAQVCGVNGLILLPDNWVCPKNLTFYPGFFGFEGEEYFAQQQSYNTTQWLKMEKSGAVFLPAAGDREYETCISSVQELGGYWTSSCFEDEYYGKLEDVAEILVFSSNVIGYNPAVFDRAFGFSVRLVKDL